MSSQLLGDSTPNAQPTQSALHNLFQPISQQARLLLILMDDPPSDVFQRSGSGIRNEWPVRFNDDPVDKPITPAEEKQIRLNQQLIRAMDSKNDQEIDQAVAAGANCQMVPNSGGYKTTALHKAVVTRNVKVIHALLSKLSEQEAAEALAVKDMNQDTPLHKLCGDHSGVAAEALGQYPGVQAVINRSNVSRDTPLVCAIQFAFPDSAKVLLRHGADPALVDPADLTGYAAEFQQVLKEAYLSLNVPQAIQTEKERLQVAELNPEQLAKLQKQTRQALGIVQRFAKAGIKLDEDDDLYDTNLSSITSNFNQALADTNQQLANLKEQKKDRPKRIELLKQVQPILQSGLACDLNALKTLADFAAKEGDPYTLVDVAHNPGAKLPDNEQDLKFLTDETRKAREEIDRELKLYIARNVKKDLKKPTAEEPKESGIVAGSN
jgi:ankyrin repeat protein